MNADLEEGILNRVVTEDESWVYEYNPCNKRQSMEWKNLMNHGQRKPECPYQK